MNESLQNYKIIIACAGLGMGNASRTAALIEALSKQSLASNYNLNITVCTWGAGYAFLNEFKKNNSLNFEIKELLPYGGGKSLFEFGNVFIRNSLKLKKEINSISPDLLILDSDYHWPSYLGSSFPKIFIGQAIDVVNRYKLSTHLFKTFSTRLNMFFREKLDAFYQLAVADIVLVPSFSPQSSQSRKIKNISLIVRGEFLKPQEQVIRPTKKIAILLSGSEIEKEAFLKIGTEYNIEVFSPQKNSLQLSHSKQLDCYEMILTQGGLTSISEVLSRGIFLGVFPIQNHPEQILNAIEIEKMKMGLMGSLDELNDFTAFLQKLTLAKDNRSHSNITCNGATEAAFIIFQTLEKHKT